MSDWIGLGYLACGMLTVGYALYAHKGTWPDEWFLGAAVVFVIWPIVLPALVASSLRARVRNRSGEAVETAQTGSTEGKSPTAKPERPKDTP